MGRSGDKTSPLLHGPSLPPSYDAIRQINHVRALSAARFPGFREACVSFPPCSEPNREFPRTKGNSPGNYKIRRPRAPPLTDLREWRCSCAAWSLGNPPQAFKFRSLQWAWFLCFLWLCGGACGGNRGALISPDIRFCWFCLFAPRGFLERHSFLFSLCPFSGCGGERVGEQRGSDIS